MSDQEAIVLRAGDAAEVRLAIAGIGSRSYAYLVDWHIRILVVLVWVLLMLLIAPSGGWLEASSGNKAAFVVAWLLPTLFYLFYHPVLEIAMKGRTPGKKVAGVRLVNTKGQPPGVGALLIRNIFRLIDSQPGFYVIGLVVAFFNKRSLRIGDLAAGTVLVFEPKSSADDLARAETVLERVGLSVQQQELLLDLLERWDSLDKAVRRRIAEQFLQKVEPGSVTPGRDDDTTLRRRLRVLMEVGARA